MVNALKGCKFPGAAAVLAGVCACVFGGSGGWGTGMALKEKEIQLISQGSRGRIGRRKCLWRPASANC